MAAAEMTKAHCNNCGAETNHAIVHIERTSGSEVYDKELGIVIDWWDRYDTLRCAGCDRVMLKHTAYFSEHDGVTIVYYPPLIARRAPTWLDGGSSVPEPIIGLLKEIYVAGQNGSRQLVAMGIRAVLDLVMANLVGDQGTFGASLEAFAAAGYLATKQKETLGAIIEAGHASTHRAWVPSNKDIGTLLGITEAVIESAYIHSKEAAALRGSVPPREKK